MGLPEAACIPPSQPHPHVLFVLSYFSLTILKRTNQFGNIESIITQINSSVELTHLWTFLITKIEIRVCFGLVRKNSDHDGFSKNEHLFRGISWVEFVFLYETVPVECPHFDIIIWVFWKLSSRNGKWSMKNYTHNLRVHWSIIRLLTNLSIYVYVVAKYKELKW